VLLRAFHLKSKDDVKPLAIDCISTTPFVESTGAIAALPRSAGTAGIAFTINVGRYEAVALAATDVRPILQPPRISRLPPAKRSTCRKEET
jgi:hypothetical protein